MQVIFEKVLSWNDCGRGRTHQSGILIPKELGRQIFSNSAIETKNPKISLELAPFGFGQELRVVITYYNSRKFGGSRDEFRLTRISTFLREADLHPGDTLIISFDQETWAGSISYERTGAAAK